MKKISLYQLGFFYEGDPYTLTQRWGTKEGLEAFKIKESIYTWIEESTPVEMEESEFRSVEDPDNPGLTIAFSATASYPSLLSCILTTSTE